MRYKGIWQHWGAGFSPLNRLKHDGRRALFLHKLHNYAAEQIHWRHTSDTSGNPGKSTRPPAPCVRVCLCVCVCMRARASMPARARARACLQAALPGFAGVAALKRVAQDPSVVRNKRALALHSLGQCAPTDDMVRAPPPQRSAPAEDCQKSSVEGGPDRALSTCF